MHRLEAVLHAVGRHTDDFHRAEIGGNKCKASNPRGEAASGEEEVNGTGYLAASREADSEDENEVNSNEGVVHPRRIEL